ncbi:MAG: Gfo/Idh/MocA family oxidoreductase [Bacteroidota bacterium]|nr:Gfo/Idh/MocA family oxidoreductase [Bacteroidota bacterium]|tara:strand:+ start:431 stop:1579 length:1149 start_codon:yes stop_codon:yes gene_type:complete
MRKLKLGMIGGGEGSFIGAIHRNAALLDNCYELTAGSFSSDYENSKLTGEKLFLDPSRIYENYEEMLEKESNISENQRIDVVSIVTPNHLHFDPAIKSLEKGLPVIIDKPMTFDTEQAKILHDKVEKTKIPFAVTHTYTGYPMVKQARSLVLDGKIGKVRKVAVEYPQGWLSTMLEKDNNKQASWRTDPSKSGKAGSMGDIGTHAANMVEYVTGKKIKRLLSKVNVFVEGRLLEDDGNVLISLEDNIEGNLMTSQIATGEENDLKIRVWGDKGGIEWKHSTPNTLIHKLSDGPNQILRAGVDNSYLSDFALAHCRTPSGHPEGFIEAFANIYRNFAYSVVNFIEKKDNDSIYDYPTVEDGYRGMKFIDAVIESSKTSEWTNV